MAETRAPRDDGAPTIEVLQSALAGAVQNCYGTNAEFESLRWLVSNLPSLVGAIPKGTKCVFRNDPHLGPSGRADDESCMVLGVAAYRVLFSDGAEKEVQASELTSAGASHE